MELDTFKENKTQFYNMREKLDNEMLRLSRYISQIKDENEDNIGQINKMLEHVTEMGKKCHLQIGIYSAFLELRDNVKKITDGVCEL